MNNIMSFFPLSSVCFIIFDCNLMMNAVETSSYYI